LQTIILELSRELWNKLVQSDRRDADVGDKESDKYAETAPKYFAERQPEMFSQNENKSDDSNTLLHNKCGFVHDFFNVFKT
jgi:uncharacterized protein with WD repeat